MERNEKKFYAIFSKRLAGYLLYEDFKLAEVRKDERGTARFIFFFFNSEELQQAIKKYDSMRSKSYGCKQSNKTIYERSYRG